MQDFTTGNPLSSFDWDFSKIEVPKFTTAMGNLSSFLEYLTPEAPMEKNRPITRIVIPKGDKFLDEYVTMAELSNLTSRVLSELGISYKWNWKYIPVLPEPDPASIYNKSDISGLLDSTNRYQVLVAIEPVSDK